jgi:hypothetical protein
MGRKLKENRSAEQVSKEVPPDYDVRNATLLTATGGKENNMNHSQQREVCSRAWPETATWFRKLFARFGATGKLIKNPGLMTPSCYNILFLAGTKFIALPWENNAN